MASLQLGACVGEGVAKRRGNMGGAGGVARVTYASAAVAMSAALCGVKKSA